jgi:ribosomal protein S18 acetylase RimI-like enzyme
MTDRLGKSGRDVEIVACPAALSIDALGLALADLTPEQRREFARVAPGQPVEALMVALSAGEVIGAAWGQRQPGSTAIFWPPRWREGEGADASSRLACAVVHALDEAGIRMSQVLLPDCNSPTALVLRAAGFEHLTDLAYLTWESVEVPVERRTSLDFVPYDGAAHERFVSVTEATYDQTLDCPALGGRRPMDEVLEGYQETGVFRPENWLLVRSGGEDVGVLLLTEHRAARHWELLYMGLVPRARGKRMGRDIVRHAQRLAHGAGAERIVLAVDAENFPAIKMYNETGFIAWDRRTVFVRFANENSQEQKTP